MPMWSEVEVLMNMSEAMEWAADFAVRSKLFDPPIKQNGYAVDGWKAPSSYDKTEIIIKLAREAMTGSADAEPVKRIATLGEPPPKPPWDDDDDTPF